MVSCLGIALFFLRFWLGTKDKLFACFAISFLALGVSQMLSLSAGSAGDYVPFAYGLRLVAFVLIIAAIATKNLSRSND